MLQYPHYPMKERERAVRAATSYAYNKELMPKVEERLAKALSLLESYLLQTGRDAVRLGRYDVERRNGEIHVVPAPPEGWEQRELELEMRPRGYAGHETQREED
jgi:hypothetical protein